MNTQDIIQLKIDELNGQPVVWTDAVKAHIAADSALQAELDFIEAFWAIPLPQSQPSSAMDAGFYAMLERAKQAQLVAPAPVAKPTWWQSLKEAFAGLTAPRFATLCAVFALGWYTAGNAPQSGNDLTALQQQVNSLNTMLAVSLLDQPNASRRLSGVAYSMESNLAAPQLLNALMDTLTHDQATPVRLAVIRALQKAQLPQNDLQQLQQLASSESNPLVQIELISLLLGKLSASEFQQFSTQLQQQAIAPDVQQFLTQIFSKQQA
ncbi:hypothetical protein [Bowmanella sp. JS7-9]|uniref:HEAT repeat-containing protein n=1 Tax=Pseudobowmanella zhangzhouensis TaxID=1537679 RepID=A0ABW1XI42_9ALTE|nr:hypothetical protein [Bowmanella sp. JS7-9]TBX21365.1 hypothetical protein TK45_12485 [Bowmanella sp. JS7-9]